MKSPIKWAGGKGKLLPALLDRMPLHYRRYYEPFAGGLALFFELQPLEAQLNDANQSLMSMYAALRDVPQMVVFYLRTFSQTSDNFYALRDLWNRGVQSRAMRAAMFIYLNKCCFNGLWRVNAAGKFNVPYRKRKATFCDPDALHLVSNVLKSAFVSFGDYQMAVRTARDGDFVYFDPPYDGMYGKYTSGGFDKGHQAALASLVDDLTKRGVSVMLSNSDTELTRRLYDGYRIDSMQVNHSVGATAERRGKVSEIIVRNY